MNSIRYEKFSKIADYKPNSRSYRLTLLSVIFELIYTVMILDVVESDRKVFGIVGLNIILLFGLFCLAVQQKNYSLRAGYIAICVGAYILVRTFTIIPFFLMPYDRNMWIVAMNICSSVLIFISAGISIDISMRRLKYMEKEEEK